MTISFDVKAAQLRRLLLFGVVLILSALTSSCIVWGYDTGDLCRCPTLIETASSIDWIGDGERPAEVTSWSGTESYPLEVDLVYDDAFSDEAVVAIAQRLIGAGYSPVNEIVLPLSRSIRFEEEDWEVAFGGVALEEGSFVRVRVYVVKPDRRADEVLAPLAEVLGMVGDA